MLYDKFQRLDTDDVKWPAEENDQMYVKLYNCTEYLFMFKKSISLQCIY